MPAVIGTGCGGLFTAASSVSSASRCRFWEPFRGAIGEPSITNGRCHRYPVPELTHKSYWCEEYKAPF